MVSCPGRARDFGEDGADMRGPAVSEGERGESGLLTGLLPGTMLGRGWADFGWLGRYGPFSLFFLFPFSFSNFLFPEKQITFEMLVQFDSNQFE